MNNGVILVDKEVGLSSSAVDRKLKAILKLDKVGHLGTLDPFASGLLLCLVNNGTKIAPFLANLTKTYRATLKLGVETDTLDNTGEIVKEEAVPKLNENKIREVLNSFLGKSKQAPPIYSALKFHGTPLYKLARSGKTIIPKERDIEIKKIDLIEYIDDLLKFEVTVSSGTYIRTLGKNIANKLGTSGHLIELIRTKIGDFSLKNAKKIDQIKVDDLISIEKVLNFIPKMTLVGEEKVKALNGVPLAFSSIAPLLLLVDELGIIAIYERKNDGIFYSKRGFR